MDIKLRDTVLDDLKDYIRWFTSDTEWMNWDAPWDTETMSEDEIKDMVLSIISSSEKRGDKAPHSRLEIISDGRHIGWVGFYYDLGWLDNGEKIPALGIDICSPSDRGGVGSEALRMYIEYLEKFGYKKLYTQTWSGNTRMAKLADKLGFTEYARNVGTRNVGEEIFDALTFVRYSNGNNFEFRKAEKNEVSLLCEYSKKAFDTDFEPDGTPCGGPPDYDSVKWHGEMQESGNLYSFILNGKVDRGSCIISSKRLSVRR